MTESLEAIPGSPSDWRTARKADPSLVIGPDDVDWIGDANFDHMAHPPVDIEWMAAHDRIVPAKQDTSR